MAVHSSWVGFGLSRRYVVRRWLDRLARWFVPLNLRKLLQTQGALDAAIAFGFTVLFFCELARPGTFTSKDTLANMTRHELRRYLAFYLWYAIMYLAQLTVSLLLYMDVRNVKYSVDGRRRTILVFLVFSPVLLVNLVLSAANVAYFPWAPLGLLYVLHTLFVAPYWLYAFRYYRWLGDGELVLFEAPLVGMRAGPSTSFGAAAVGVAEDAELEAEAEAEAVGVSEPPVGKAVAVARLVSISETEADEP